MSSFDNIAAENAADKELQEFLLVEKQKAQVHSQVKPHIIHLLHHSYRLNK